MKDKTLKQIIEAHFIEILNTHMSKNPMLNSAVRVEAVGFCKWQSHDLCVVITPWFMSLYLVPEELGDQKNPSIDNGTITQHRFDNGSYSFTFANDELIGAYETCTLFSSMLDFNSHAQAKEVALETIRLLLGKEQTLSSKTKVEDKASSRRELFRSTIRRGKNA